MSETPFHVRDSRIVLAYEQGRERFIELEGSPLEQCTNMSRVAWQDGMADDERAEVFDASLPGADAIVVAPWLGRIPPFDEARWKLASDLKVIAGTFDNRFGHWIDVADAQRRGVTLIDTSRSMTPTVAEFALAMILNLMREIPAAVELTRRGEWTKGTWDVPGMVYGDLTGRRVGLAGFGSINRRLAEFLRSFQCELMTHDPFLRDDDPAADGIERIDSLAGLAERSEIFVIGIPPTPATHGIISREVINALPRGACLVLVTRMAVVDQEALWRRAEGGEIRAAIDVFAPEPPPSDASFLTSPYVIPTPHIAGNTFDCHRRCFTTACQDALAVLAGQAPRYPVTVHDDRLYQGTLVANP